MAEQGIEAHYVLPQSAPLQDGSLHLPLVAPGTSWARFKGLGGVIRSVQPTHVFCYTPPDTALLSQAALNAPRARLYASCLGTEARRLQGAKWHEKAVLAIARRKLSGVFTQTSIGSDKLHDLGLRSVQIPLSYAAETFFVQPVKQRSETRAFLRISAPVVGYFSTVQPEYGLHILLRAFSKVKHCNWTLLLPSLSAKDSYARHLMAQIVTLGLRDHIAYYDPSPDELPDYINIADLVVAPSVKGANANSGEVLRAAMGCGRMVLASDTPTNSEALGGFGHLFLPGDPEALAHRLSVLLDQGPSQDLKAARWAQRNWTRQNQAKAILDELHRPAAQQSGTTLQETSHVA